MTSHRATVVFAALLTFASPLRANAAGPVVASAASNQFGNDHGVTVFRLSSPEPSRDGISWHVEKDITAYAPLFEHAQSLAMHLGNVVNDKYTGVFQINAQLVLYPVEDARPAARTTDIVAPLDALHQDVPDSVGSVVLPANAEREVYTTGSVGGQAPQVDTQTLRFGLDGGIVTREVGGKPRLTTTLNIHDDADRRRSVSSLSTENP